jgi:hypothetical protein
LNTPVLGLIDGGAGSTNAKLVFTEGGLSGPPLLVAAVMAPDVSQIPLRISTANAATFPVPTNPARATLNLTTSSGIMTGGFTLANDPDPRLPTTLLTRNVSYFGVLVPRLRLGVGQFQLAELPSDVPPATTQLTSPEWSGQVLLEP